MPSSIWGGYGVRGSPLDDFFAEKQNVEMAYNVMRCAYDAGVPRIVVASSNHAADWYEHALIHRRKLEVLDPVHPTAVGQLLRLGQSYLRAHGVPVRVWVLGVSRPIGQRAPQVQ